jgi:arylsulfatase A-like enzyme
MLPWRRFAKRHRRGARVPLDSSDRGKTAGPLSHPLWDLLFVCAPFLALLVGGAYPLELDFAELRWILEGRGALPHLADAWLGVATSAALLRLPFLLAALAGLLLALRAAQGRHGRTIAALALMVVGVFPLTLAGASLLGPWSLGLLTAGAALALATRPGRGPLAWLLVLAALSGWLDPGLAVAPLGVALAQLFSRRHAPLPALLVVGGGGLLWMSFETTAELSSAPLAGAILCLVLAVVLALPTPRAALLGTAVLFLAFAAAPRLLTLPGAALRGAVGASLVSAGAAEGGAGELLAGPGLSEGFTAHMARELGMQPSRRSSPGKVALLELAAARGTEPERRALEERLGRRVLESSILAGEKDLLLRFNVYRPVSLAIDEGGPRPNIAIVSVDTLRADALPFYGYERDTAPALGRWSEEALVYERAFAPASKTAPSFASLMTGRLPVDHGLRSNYDLLDPGNWTLARVLREAGYHTAAFVSSFVLTRDNCGLDLGFELYDETLDRVELRREHRPLRLAPELAGAVEAWAEGRREAAGPWLLWIHAIDPHGPYTPLPEFEGSFRSQVVRLLDRESIPDHQWLETEDFSVYRDAYDAEILQTDRSLGELLDTLRALPSPEGLIVVFLSDHGESFGERDVFFQHGQSLHQEQARIPLVVQDSAFPAAGRESRPVSLVDLMPTLLERLAIETDLPLEGLPLGRRVSEAAPVLGGWRPGEAMALRFPWKLHLLRHPDGEEWVEVYDLRTDPGESHPLPPDEERHGDLLAAARGLLDRDPLKGTLDEVLRRERWEALSPEEMEQLRALGYLGP